MKTNHRIIYANASDMDALSSESVDLTVTSPPYPMIEMWDEMFARQNSSVKAALDKGDGAEAFELMHRVLDPVWKEVYRVLKSGGFACVNIGDATRTVNGNFALYPNHMRILKKALELGFSVLPCILWRKQTNAPNKFMGSGMLPAGAYVTLEHEYILILRKGPKREFKKEEDKKRRRESAIFWEERNRWFSDVWFDVKGAPQALNDKGARLRSAAYPFEVVNRLINMYSVKGDLVLDPFLGTGTTTAAAMASGRNSIGYEIDRSLEKSIHRIKDVIFDFSRQLTRERLAKHMAFVVQRLKTDGGFKHNNEHYGFPVMTAQERELIFNDPMRIAVPEANTFEIEYSEKPQPEFCKNWSAELQKQKLDVVERRLQDDATGKDPAQMRLF
ncbi:MAG: site-specific DNA-methyltransferase [Deltaproteobacteria bacterium]|nr:site-specific DNA-methyltransferase [Deltaproteobacteria bacterium]